MIDCMTDVLIGTGAILVAAAVITAVITFIGSVLGFLLDTLSGR